MKFNVTVDLSDFYSEEDEKTFSEQIKCEIFRQVKYDVLASFKETMKDEFTKQVIEVVREEKEEFIVSVLKELVVDSKIKKRYNSNELISVRDWIIEDLNRTYLSDGSLKDYLNKETKKTTENIISTLKERYDMLFASQIVSKLNENGMLKDDVAKLLLN